MKIGIRHHGAGAALVIALAAGSAHAGAGDVVDLVSTGTPSTFGVADRANLTSEGIATNLVQRFVLPTASEITQISFFGSASNVDLYLTDLVGSSASEVDNILWSSNGFTTQGGKAWRDVGVSGLTLDAGTYYLVMASDSSTGGLWSRTSRTPEFALNTEARGVGSYTKLGPDQTVATLTYNFLEQDTLGYAIRVQGREAAIPAPGMLAMAGMGGLLAARRRRR